MSDSALPASGASVPGAPAPGDSVRRSDASSDALLEALLTYPARYHAPVRPNRVAVGDIASGSHAVKQGDRVDAPDDDGRRHLRAWERLRAVLDGTAPGLPFEAIEEEALLGDEALDDDTLADEVPASWASLRSFPEGGGAASLGARAQRLLAAAVPDDVPAPADDLEEDDPASARVTPWVWTMGLLVALALSVVALQRPAPPALVAHAADALATYTTEGGSVVRLRPHSTLYRVAAPDGRERYRVEGEAYFDVRPDAARAFEVEVGAGVVRGRSTRFTVRTWSTSPEVFLEKGRATFAAGAARVTLAPGQRSAVAVGGSGVTEPQAASADAALDWLARVVRFEQQPVRDVVAEVAHHYALRLDVPPRLAAQTRSGRVLLDDRAQALADLGAVLGGRFEPTGPGAYRFTLTPSGAPATGAPARD
jgi:transmembrane sensor